MTCFTEIKTTKRHVFSDGIGIAIPFMKSKMINNLNT